MIRVYTRIMDGETVVVEHVVELPRDASPVAPANDQIKPTMVREGDAVAEIIRKAKADRPALKNGGL